MEKQNKKQKSNDGITLIALVVTIVVLLIFASVSITVVFGDNGILELASEASVKTKLSTVEDLVNQKYMAGIISQQAGGTSDEITMDDISSFIEDQGYEVESRSITGTQITGIKLNNEQIKMAPNSEATIKVTVESTSGEDTQYYVKVDGKYYKIIQNNGGIVIEKKETKLTAEEKTKEVLTAEVTDGSSVTVKSIEGKTITLESRETVGKTTITVKYGEYTKTCVITVAKKPTESSEAKPTTTVTTSYGKVDVIWLSGSTDKTVSNTPNAPILTSNGEMMKKVKWSANGSGGAK